LSIILLIIGTFFSYLSLKQSNDHDPSYIVIDEWVGQWIALSFLPVSLSYGLIALALFRFFDISKVGPVGYFEKLPGAIGVMLDDVVAGILTMVIIFTVRFFFL
jgi:phosphatidylglycerophosphatase A